MTEISKLAEVSASAGIGENVTIGPFCVVGPDVVIGDGCHLMNNVTVIGNTEIGRWNTFYPNVVVGVHPQDLKYQNTPTKTILGDDNILRENVTIHRGTELGLGRTVLGTGNLLMVGVHIAHDCVLGDANILANQVQLAGHVSIESHTVISALVGLHHFVRVGRYSYIGGLTPVRRDVPPYLKFGGDPNAVRAVNEEGLKRNAFTPEQIAALKQTFKELYRKGTSLEAAVKAVLARENLEEHVQYLCDFIHKSCQGRFGRYEENFRRDRFEDRVRKQSAETPHNHK